jgi:hypothetical protein
MRGSGPIDRRRTLMASLRLARAAIAAPFTILLSLVHPGPQADPGRLKEINHIVVIYQKNWSFDSLYGNFPGEMALRTPAQRSSRSTSKERPWLSCPSPWIRRLSQADPGRPLRGREASGRALRPGPLRSGGPAQRRLGARILSRAVSDRRRQDGPGSSRDNADHGGLRRPEAEA